MRSRPHTSWRSVLVGLLLLAARLVHSGVLIERTVAFVNNKTILLSDALLTKALLHIELDQAIERTIDEVLMYDEASRLIADTAKEKDVSAAVQALSEKAGPSFGAPALRRKALAQLAIARYIDLRLRPLVRVGDDEVRRTFNEKLAKDPTSPTLSEAAPAIREILERQSLDQKIEEWVSSLRRREEVRRPLPRPR